MNQKYLILVEGKADKKFLEDYIKHNYNNFNENIKIEINNGNSFNEKKIIHIKKYIDDNHKLIVIFDADNDIQNSIDNIKNNLTNYNLHDEDIFLFPNNKDNGNLENILINIAVRKEIMNCFDNYTKCIEALNDTNIPVNKSKVYAYLESIKVDNKKEIKEDKRDYTNNEIWNIDSDYLIPLKIFFDKHFVNGN
ncbi:DUF3226 domain-containing protein [Brachyspira hyodysenteriae]|uniref:DUF4435 domain-containing protein n=2 Tax=Brachyspira hyodysenteriae TaxID=159 RepID=A0A3B6VD01_BRAHW|nr:DUF3226 domain-containing protein [Brachyspira hyodysenteriae]ACN84717.1 hypothetical protein BHWA1_02261 [Brachyspira hyodysenteriae WA1]AUJ50448.1 hypothetical protein BH718_02016 [Brachyspira hyodysenteriae]KLI16107.1 hypothetical protein SU45_09485 [Brachyspira hyodysenteriae]KLI22011.1 hypothetical protein SU46_00525 [Brachyspira hyodysenteriae]KLI25269.1 hypothetical protein SR30_07140 [Brachyspira hyodysenteriae]